MLEPMHGYKSTKRIYEQSVVESVVKSVVKSVVDFLKSVEKSVKSVEKSVVEFCESVVKKNRVMVISMVIPFPLISVVNS